MSGTATYNCKQCKTPFIARAADRKRGWAQFCSKACKATTQSKATGIKGPHSLAIGKTVQQMSGKKFSHQLSRFEREIAQDEYGIRKLCHCGEPATRFVQSGFGNNGWEGQCDDHADDTHPFDGENFNYE